MEIVDVTEERHYIVRVRTSPCVYNFRRDSSAKWEELKYIRRDGHDFDVYVEVNPTLSEELEKAFLESKES